MAEGEDGRDQPTSPERDRSLQAATASERPRGPAPQGEVLVTGAGGFLGGAIARRLVDLGHAVRSASRRPHEHLATLGVQHAQIDLGAPDASAALAKHAERCQAIFHVAALTGAWGRWRDFERANVLGTQQVVDACVRAGVEVLVHTSTPSVVFDGSDQIEVDETTPPSTSHHAHYTRSKAKAEHIVLHQGPERGLRCVALRPHLVWGPGDTSLLPRIIQRARAGRLRRIVAPGHAKQIAPTYIDDAVDAHLLAWSALGRAPQLSGNAYFITSGESVEPWWMIDRLLESQGLAPLRQEISLRTAMTAAAALELLWWVLRRGGEPPLTRWVVRELTSSHTFDLERARQDLGFTPRWSVADGLAELRRVSTHDRTSELESAGQ